MAYKILSLKWRPSNFSEVVGQDHISNALSNAIKLDRIAHAFTFSGPRGVGKTSTARILAKELNKVDNVNESIDIIEMDAASNRGIDEIRNLRESVNYAPANGKYKIYIIDEAHMLSTAAFNAFLKTLEEPPKHAIFILATTEKNKIIPTILSRCQIYDFKSINNNDISLHLKNISLKNNIKFEDEALNIISKIADGAMRDALSLYDRLINLTNGNITTLLVSENLSILNLEIYIQLTEKLISNNIPGILIYLDDILKKGFSHLDFLNGLSNYFRNLLLSKNSNTLKYISLKESILKKITNQSDKINVKKIVKSIGIINASEINYKKSKNKRLHVEFCLLDIAGKLSGLKKKNKIVEKSFEKKNETIINSKETSKREKFKKTESVILTNIEGSNNLNVSGLSLSSIKFKKENEKIQLEKTNNSEGIILEENFTKNKLNSIWSAYLKNKLDKGENNIASILRINKPEIEGKNIITYSVLNDSNKIELEEEKNNLLPFLKKQLKNNQITLNIIVNKATIKKTNYSDKEKYKFLLKKNSKLEKLRTTFNLEF